LLFGTGGGGGGGGAGGSGGGGAGGADFIGPLEMLRLQLAHLLF